MKADTAAAKLDEAFEDLKRRAADAGSTASESPAISHDPVEEAKLVLQAPRYKAFAEKKVLGDS